MGHWKQNLMLPKFIKNTSLILLVLLSHSIVDADILRTAAQNFYSKADRTQFGIEYEFGGISLKDAAELVQNHFGGTIRTAPKTYRFIKTNGKTYDVVEDIYVVETSKYGSILIRKDYSETGSRIMEGSHFCVEISTSKKMMTINQHLDWVDLAEKLKAKKALGAPQLDVGTHYTIGVSQNFTVDNLVNLLRVYYLPAHRQQIKDHLSVSANREKFFNDLTPGFKNKLYKKPYKPSKYELFFDYVYRQTLELSGDPEAWKLSEDEVRRRVLALKNPMDFRVTKFTALRISSLLLSWFPEDPLSKIYLDSLWIKALPVLEFREANFDFNVESRPKELLGLISMVRRFGAFDHDTLMSVLTGLDPSVMKDLRLKEKDGKPVILRFALEDLKLSHDGTNLGLRELYRRSGVSLGFIDHKTLPSVAYPLPSNAVAFTRLPHHEGVVASDVSNPGASNSLLVRALENKWFEYRFWTEFAANAFPTTESLAEMGISSVEEMKTKFDGLFPNGWVLKRVWDQASQPLYSTDDVVREYKTFLEVGFEELVQEATKRYRGRDPEYLISFLAKQPGYKGWKINGALKFPHNYIVQEALAIKKEYRVEVFLGKVLKGATVDRWAFEAEEKGEPFEYSSAETLKRVEKYVQSVVNNLPKGVADTNFAFDVALLENGSFKVIETNAGSNSGFLAEEGRSVRLINYELEKIAAQDRPSAGFGLSRREQLEFVAERFLLWNMDPSRFYASFDYKQGEQFEYARLSRTPKQVRDTLFSGKTLSIDDNMFRTAHVLDGIRQRLWAAGRFNQAYIDGDLRTAIEKHVFQKEAFSPHKVNLYYVASRRDVNESLSKIKQVFQSSKIDIINNQQNSSEISLTVKTEGVEIKIVFVGDSSDLPQGKIKLSPKGDGVLSSVKKIKPSLSVKEARIGLSCRRLFKK